MPRLFHRLVKDKSGSDLKVLIEQLIVHLEKCGGLNSFDKIDRQLLENVTSYYKKLDELSQQEINIIWETASKLVKDLLKTRDVDLIDKINRDNEVENKNLLYGKYWIFPKNIKYISCDDHVKFARENEKLFTEDLGVNSYDYLHAINSGEMNVIPLIFSAGGIMADFLMEDGKKVARFQLAQCSLSWLKSRLMNMPIFKSHIRVLNPHDSYKDEKDGIYFVFRRKVGERGEKKV
jgi:hypothetical protein